MKMTFAEKLRVGVLAKKFYRSFRGLNKTLTIKEVKEEAIDFAKEIVKYERYER